MGPIKSAVEIWPIAKLVFYVRNPRKNDAVVDRMCSSIGEFGFKIPVLARSDGEVVDGHLRLKAAKKLGIEEIPVILCDEWTPAQVKAFRLLVNQSASWASWDTELLSLEMLDLKTLEFDLSLSGFGVKEIDDLLLSSQPDAEVVPPLPVEPVSRLGDLWLCGKHRVLCGDCTSAEAVARLLGDQKPILMTTDPPYGIGLDGQWRDRAGLNTGLPGKNRTATSKAVAKSKPPQYAAEPSFSDTRTDWAEAFQLVPSLQVAYVWHASCFIREVLDGLLRLGFDHHQQIIWDKQRTVLTRTLYWYQHEACWFVWKKNAPWFGKAGENSTVWSFPSPKFIMGGSKESKYDHPTQKPIELFRKPILNHLKRGGLVYEPFLGSGTALAAAEITERICYGMEVDPKYVDVTVLRWQTLSGKSATLEATGQTFEQVKEQR